MKVNEVLLPQFIYIPRIVRGVGGYGRELMVGDTESLYLFRDYSLVKGVSESNGLVAVGRDYVYAYNSIDIYNHDLGYVTYIGAGLFSSIAVGDYVYMLRPNGSIDVFDPMLKTKIQTTPSRGKPLGIGVVNQGVIAAFDTGKRVSDEKTRVDEVVLYDSNMGVKRSVEVITACGDAFVQVHYSFASINDSIIMGCRIGNDVLITMFDPDLTVRGANKIHVFYDVIKHYKQLYVFDTADANNKWKPMLSQIYINNDYVIFGAQNLLTLVPVPWALGGEPVNYKIMSPGITIIITIQQATPVEEGGSFLEPVNVGFMEPPHHS